VEVAGLPFVINAVNHHQPAGAHPHQHLQAIASGAQPSDLATEQPDGKPPELMHAALNGTANGEMIVDAQNTAA